MQKSDVRHGLGDRLAVEFEHEPQHSVRRGVRRPHVEDHFLADVVIGFAQLRLFGSDSRYWIGRFNLANGECHTLVYARE